MSSLRHRLYRSLFLICLFLGVYPHPLIAGVVEQVIVVIDGEPHTLSDLKEYARARMDREFPKGDLKRIEQEDKEVLEQFITEKLLAAEVKQAGIKVSDEEIDRSIHQIKERNGINDEQLAAALKLEGVTMEGYRASIRGEIERAEIINRQVRKRVNITKEDVERFYKMNPRSFATGDRVRLRHILFALPERAPAEREKQVLLKANEIRGRALAKEDFARLAQEFSEGAGASEGGDLGWVKRGSLLKEIDDIAFNKLSVGEISQPLRTSLGIHLIKLELKESGKLPSLSEVQGKIKEELYAKALEERFQKWLKTDLRKKHRVDVKLAGVVFRAEETKEGTVDSLMARASRRARNEDSSAWSYFNPLSYIFKTTPLEGEDGELAGQGIVSLFGLPLFRTDSVADVPEEVLPPLDQPVSSAKQPQESRGFFSSILNAINPFSKNR